MTEPKTSIADRLNVTRYDEGFAANADRAAQATPVVGEVWKTGKSIAAHAQDAVNADNIGDLASAAGELAADGAKFVGSAAADVTMFAMDPIGWLVSHGLNMLLELVHPLQDALHQVTGGRSRDRARLGELRVDRARLRRARRRLRENR